MAGPKAPRRSRVSADSSPGAPHLLAQHLNCSIINAGDGAHEHPTQGLLDIFTIRRRKGRLEGLTVGCSLPLLPLALRGGLIVPLDLDATYTAARQRSRLA